MIPACRNNGHCFLPAVVADRKISIADRTHVFLEQSLKIALCYWKVTVQDLDIFAINANPSHDCATIDRCGPTSNVESANCMKEAQYICEFAPDEDGTPPESCEVL